MRSSIARATANFTHFIASKMIYSVIEGFAFLFTKPAAGLILFAESLVLIRSVGLSIAIQTAAQASVACVIGRAVWAFSHVRTARNPSTSASPSSAQQPNNNNTKSTSTLQQQQPIPLQNPLPSASLWDWEPPTSDPLASGAWHIIKNLALTANSLKEQNPEFFDILSKPELAPSELFLRLHFLASATEREDINTAYPGIDVCSPTTTTTTTTEGNDGSQIQIPLFSDVNSVVPAPAAYLDILKSYRKYACYAYDLTNDAALSSALNDEGYQLIAAKYEPDVSSGCPAYYIAVSSSEESKSANNEKKVIVALRGTYSPEDVFTDLMMVGEVFGGDIAPGTNTACRAHAGMAKGATFLSEKFGGMLCALRDAGYKVILVGHSLGAGISSLLALRLLRLGFDPDSLLCIAFEPPACMDAALSLACRDVVLSLVNEDDIVPRMSMPIFRNLLQELVDFDWRAEADREGVVVPPPVAMMQKIGLLPSTTSKGSAVDVDDVGVRTTENRADGLKMNEVEAPQIAMDSNEEILSEYDPVVPGKVIFICLPPGDEIDGTKAKRVLIHNPMHPVLRRIRISSRMLSDHFIDSEHIISALG